MYNLTAFKSYRFTGFAALQPCIAALQTYMLTVLQAYRVCSLTALQVYRLTALQVYTLTTLQDYRLIAALQANKTLQAYMPTGLQA